MISGTCTVDFSIVGVVITLPVILSLHISRNKPTSTPERYDRSVDIQCLLAERMIYNLEVEPASHHCTV